MSPLAALRGAQIALLGLCAWLAHSTLEALAAPVDPPPAPDLAALAAAAAVPPPAADLARYRVIAERDLFRASAPSDAAPAADAAFAETRLPLRLRGTLVASLARGSLATIEDQRAGETHVLHEGEWLGETRVERIRRGSVLLSHAAGTEQLSFQPDEPGAASGAPAARGAKRAAAPSPGGTPAARPTARARPASERAPRDRPATPPPSSVEAAARAAEAEAAPSAPDDERLRELAAQARFLPEFAEQGGLRGIRLQDVQPGTPLARLGLQDGDVIVAVAGRRIEGASEDVFQTLRGLDVSRGVRVELERAGVPSVLDVPPGVL